MKSKFMMILMILMILVCSCNKQNNDLTEPDYKAFKDMTVNINKSLTEDNDEADTGHETTANTATNEDEYSDNEKNDSKEDFHNDTNDNNENESASANFTIIEASKKDWPYALYFSGIGEELIPTTKGNIQANYKKLTRESYLICPDEQRDCVYFINYNKDNYIYQLKDGVISLLVDKKTAYLQLWNNELYFIHNISDGDDIYGNICCYNFDSKECRVYIDIIATKLFIDSDGILFGDYNPETNSFYAKRLEFGSDTPRYEDYIICFSFENYAIHNDEMYEAVYIYNKKTGDKAFVAPIEYYDKINVFDKYMSFTKGSCVYFLDLISGEKRIYDFNDCKDIGDPIHSIINYIIVDNILYATVNLSGLISLNLETEAIAYIKSNNILESYDILYAGNGKLFGYSLMNGKLAEITINNDKYTARGINR